MTWVWHQCQAQVDREGGNLHLEIEDYGWQSGKEGSPKGMDKWEIKEREFGEAAMDYEWSDLGVAWDRCCSGSLVREPVWS